MGAEFDPATKVEYTDIQAELATLQTKFRQNILNFEEDWELFLTNKDFEGCPADVVAAARQVAIDKKYGPDDYVMTLGRSMVEPFLSYSTRRDLRKTIFEAFSMRGESLLSPERDNLKIATEILRLRRRQAQLHNKRSFSEYQFEVT